MNTEEDCSTNLNVKKKSMRNGSCSKTSTKITLQKGINITNKSVSYASHRNEEGVPENLRQSLELRQTAG